MRPLVVTAGDPAGIGPQIVRKAFAALGDSIPMAVLGDADQFRSLGPGVQVIGAPDEARPGALCVLHRPLLAEVTPGKASRANAPWTIGLIEEAVALVMAGQGKAVVTAPINKQVLKEGAGFGFPGHTEFLAHLAGAPRPVMMLAGGGLRVVPVTIHIPLAEVPGALTADLLAETIRVTHTGLKGVIGMEHPRIAVAGLNPHAGEGGTMGREELDLIGPVLRELADEGLSVTGPHSADTLFHAEARARYDVAVTMYHDQGLIPIKTLAFDSGVNVTLGLPFLRTSPDHGTAYDIAASGTASAASMIEAIRFAWEHGH